MKLAKSSKLLTTACALALAMGVVRSAHADHRSFPHGPKFSVDVETFCGDPYAVELDEDGEVLNTFNENVAVRVTDVSDDNGPADAEVGLLTIKCTAAVKQGRAKPAQASLMRPARWVRCRPAQRNGKRGRRHRVEMCDARCLTTAKRSPYHKAGGRLRSKPK